STPDDTSASASMSPKVWIVRPKMWSSASTGSHCTPGLEVAHRVDRHAVDARLEVHVRAEAVARAVRDPDHLALRDALADRHEDALLMAVTGGEPAAVADAGVVAVAGHPAGDQDLAGL